MHLLLLACAAAPQDPPGDPPSGTEPTPDEPADEAQVARVTVPGSFGTRGDSWTLRTGEEVLDAAQAFYEAYPGDDHDFLIFWTERPVADLWAFTIPVDASIEGIGLQEVMDLYGWDYTPADAGSDGRLQALCLMNDPSTYAAATYWDASDILTHEVGHRWSANLRLDAPDPWVLTDTWWSHWNVHANVGGPSAVGYGELVDEGDTFQYTLASPLVYSDLELYQQGLLGAEEVGPMYYVGDPSAYDPPEYYGTPWTNDACGTEVRFSGTRTDFDMDDVQAVHGPRVPERGPTTQRFAFVLLCEDAAACDPEVLAWVEEQRLLWPEAWSRATRARSTAEVDLGG